MSKFDDYFGVRKNLVFERATFNQARQLSDETAEHFITRLHRLAETCEFGELKSDMIRDRLVIGIRDGQLSERLQLESDLTLQKAEKLVRQRQAVQEQKVTLKQSATLQQLDRVTRHTPKLPIKKETSEEAFTLMFLIYINDIGKNLSCCLRLFADDCLLYHVITSEEDCAKLQHDLNTIYKWSCTWQMKFS